VPRKSSASGDAINDIARETGVSIATVSRVLNGRPDVASATRSEVLAYIRQRDYVSNRIARAGGDPGLGGQRRARLARQRGLGHHPG